MNIEQQELGINRSVTRTCERIGVGVAIRHEAERMDDCFVATITLKYDLCLRQRSAQLQSIALTIVGMVLFLLAVATKAAWLILPGLSIAIGGVVANIWAVHFYPAKTTEEVNEAILLGLARDGFSARKEGNHWRFDR